MRLTTRAGGLIAVALATLLAIVLVAVPGAGAVPGQEPPQISSHCGGAVLVQSNLETDTVTSTWLFNSSVIFPPLCHQYAVAVCDQFLFVEGPPRTAIGEASSVTCPAGTSLWWGFAAVEHAA